MQLVLALQSVPDPSSIMLFFHQLRFSEDHHIRLMPGDDPMQLVFHRRQTHDIPCQNFE